MQKAQFCNSGTARDAHHEITLYSLVFLYETCNTWVIIGYPQAHQCIPFICVDGK